jgi:hypothetical protein
MQESPLLNNEISGFENNDEQKNEFYTKELETLFNEIIQDLQKADITGTGRVSEDELLEYLQSKLPPNKQLNVPLFKQLLQNIDRNIDMNIDLNDFCKKYIQAHEELKLNFETLKKGIDKEKNLKNELESKIQEVKQEKLNKNGISPNACVSTEIGKITFLNQINADQIYCSVKLDENDEKRTIPKSIDKANFTEKFTFPIEDKQSTLSYKFFSAISNQFIGATDVPLYIINLENEEVNPDFEIKDDNDLNIGVFKPKIIIVTSYYDMYQKQYDNIDKNIESYQNRINQLSETLDDISLPYKSEFERSQLRLLKGSNMVINDGELVNRVEDVLKHAFKDKKVKWVITLKFILYFCILTILFTTLVKPDFISLFICLILLILLNTGKSSYILDHFKIILIGILIMIGYDLIDYIFLRKFQVEVMSAVEGWGRFFGFLGFLGKIALLFSAFIVKVKYEKTGLIID